MTLNEVAIKYDVEVTDLLKELNIPATLSDIKIGRLKRQYDFHNSEIREAILKFSSD